MCILLLCIIYYMYIYKYIYVYAYVIYGLYMLQTSTNNLDIQKTQGLFKEGCGNDRILRSQACKEKEKKDLTAIVNTLQKKQIENLQTNTQRLCLETVHSNSSAVYQTVESVLSTESHTDLMKAQVFINNCNTCK